MKKISSVFFACLLAAGLFSCTKEGPRGPKGATGAPGVDGNANVKTYIITDTALLKWDAGYQMVLFFDSTFVIPDSIQEDGMILIYVKYGDGFDNWWYFTPGMGPAATFQTRVYYSSTYLVIQALNPDGTFYSGGVLPPAVKMRIVLVSPSEVALIERKSAMPDFSDYETAMEHFRIND